MCPLLLDGRPEYEYTEGNYCLILLQFTSYHEYAVAISIRRDFLDSTNALKPLSGPALGKNNIHFKAITDLSIEKRSGREGGNKEDQNA